MRKTLLLTMFLIVVLLSGCAMKSEEEPYGESSSFDSYLNYDFDTLTYTNTNESDLLFNLGSASSDYIIMTKEEQGELSDISIEAYGSILNVLDQIASLDYTFHFEEITTYSSRDLEDFAGKVQLELTITDIITFNSIKSDIESYTDSYVSGISKQDYIENRIDRDLTPDELQGFFILQERYYELMYYNEATYSFETNTFEELLLLFNDKIGYTPLEENEPKLEAAYNILNLIHAE